MASSKSKKTTKAARPRAVASTRSDTERPGVEAANEDRAANDALIAEGKPHVSPPPPILDEVAPWVPPATPIRNGVADPSPVEVEAPRPPRRTVRVRAKADGYSGDIYRRAGDVFDIDATPRSEAAGSEKADAAAKARRDSQPAAFSEKWMERVDGHERTRVTTPQEHLTRTNEEEKKARLAENQAASRATNPIGAD